MDDQIETIKITLIDHTSANKALGRVLAFVFPATLIGAGVLADSTAMQWSGFVVWLLSLFVIAQKLGARNADLTFDEARKRIDEIEARNA